MEPVHVNWPAVASLTLLPGEHFLPGFSGPLIPAAHGCAQWYLAESLNSAGAILAGLILVVRTCQVHTV